MVARSLGTTRAVTTTAADRNRRRHLLIFRHGTIEEGKLKGLQTQQTLADRGIGIRVELAALQVAKKLVQRIVSTLTIIGVASLLSLAQGIVHIAVGMRVGGLRWGVWLVVLWGRCVRILPIDAVDRALEVMGGSSITLRVLREHHIRMLHARFRRADLRVVGMGLDMLLQILRSLESLTTEVTLVRLERHVNTDVGRDMITLDCGRVASTPLTGQVEIVGAFTSNMSLTNMLLSVISIFFFLELIDPTYIERLSIG